jgi:hypothetical protein
MPALLKGVLVPNISDAILNVHLPIILNDQVHPMSTSMPDKCSCRGQHCWRPSSSGNPPARRPKSAYGEGDESLLVGPITRRLGYRWSRKLSEVWPRERMFQVPMGTWFQVPMGTWFQVPGSLKQAPDRSDECPG